MKTKLITTIILSVIAGMFAVSCDGGENGSAKADSAGVTTSLPPAGGGQSSVQDDVSQKDIVKVAVGSPDHTTLVTALQAADLVNVMSNAGPFTVFAPTNAAFNALPAGTVETLLKPENKDQLASILQHHVTVSTYSAESLKDGQILGMVDGNNVTVKVTDGKISIDGANVVASVRASNGIVHIVDKVILVPEKK